MKKASSGGGWPAIWYTLRKGREAGGFWKLWRAMRSKNACKTCALGMGGQRGGMVNEQGHFPEVCKKSLQAMVADMQGAIQSELWQRYPVDKLKTLSPRELENCGRLTHPVLYTPELRRYQPISWEDALARIGSKLAALAPDETFWYFSGRSSNEAGFLLQLFARLYGTNNVNNCSYYCHQASGVGLSSTVGSGTATIVLDDFATADLVFLIGGNPASNHPRLMRTLMEVRRRGGEVIVINPIVETGLVNFRVPSDVRSLLFGTRIASLYVQPHIGGDLALLTGIAKRVVEFGAYHEPFLETHCRGWSELSAALAATSWDEIVAKSGVSQEQIDDIARRYARSSNAIFSWTMGITHHAHGVQNVQAIANLALLRGMVGRPGAGLLPIRGHSNVQGIGSMGVTPQLKAAVFERLESHFGVQLPTTTGLDTMGCIEQAAEGRLKFGLCLGGNLYGSNPDAKFAQRAIENLDMIVYLSTTLNTGHAYVLARDEEPQATTQESMFNFVRLSSGGPRRHGGPQSEVEVIAKIAQAVLTDETASGVGGAEAATPPAAANARHSNLKSLDWRAMRNTGRIREAIAAIVPGFDKLATIDTAGEEFQIGGRTFHEPKFATPDGRAVLHAHPLPELSGNGRDELRLMTIRSEGQFNTVVYEDYDTYRGIVDRNVVLVHPDDLARLGLASAKTVSVHGPAGSLTGVRAHPFTEIKPGNAAMYYPEANVLVSRQLDPASRTPAFKCVVVKLTAELPQSSRVVSN